MLKSIPINFGNLRGTIYDFVDVNDVLPMHWHTEDNVHITIVAKGSFKVIGTNWEKIMIAGNVVDWNPYQWHEFISLEPDSRLVNIVKGNGQSISEYGNLPSNAISI